jgi:hypothetical protein
MGQLEDYWVPKSIFDEELKRRQDAEKKLDEVLRYLDPQPKGGPIYAAPYPEPGDLGQRMVALVEEWEHEAAEIVVGVDLTGFLAIAHPKKLCSDLLKHTAKQLRTALGEHAAKGTEKPEWLYGPPVVTVHVEEGQEGMCIEPILVAVGAARSKDDAHDLIGSGVVRIEECHVVESHWRGADQEFTLFVGDGFKCRVKLTSEPEPRGGIIIPGTKIEADETVEQKEE